MKLKILGSNSAGNCYLFKAKEETLIVECGVSAKRIKEGLGFELEKVVGCIITHEHLDHCRGAQGLTKSGIDIYSSPGTIEALSFTSHRLKKIRSMEQAVIGSFTIIPFHVKHDCEEPFGYLIHQPECGNVLFITDSFYVPFTFGDLNNVIIEANYSEEILTNRAQEGTENRFVAQRVIDSHLSLETCLKVLEGNDLSRVNNIVLIHLSNRNSDANAFKNAVRLATEKNVWVADKGLEISFNKTPF